MTRNPYAKARHTGQQRTSIHMDKRGVIIEEIDWQALQEALDADGEKLRQITGEDHGPWFVDDEAPSEDEDHEILKGCR